jgi:hypothetical protein
MTADITITTAGIKDALRVLNSIDKKARRAITTEYKEIVQPVVAQAQNFVPNKPPLSGMGRSWTPDGSNYEVLPYSKSPKQRPPQLTFGANQMQSRGGRREVANWLQWQAGIRAYVSGKRPQTMGGYTRNLAAFGIKWQGPAAVLFDTSGQGSTPQGQQMIRALNARYGKPSRVMWRAYERADRDLQNQVEQLMRKIMRQASGELR